MLCASDGEKTVIAPKAEKGRDYTCLVCGERLRLRSGRRIRTHFYHVRHKPNCSHKQKSMIHMQTQYHLFQVFKGARMEYYFPSINRFADVAVPEKKLVFEVQCSPISLQEVRARQKAYAETGYQLIWILHEKSFNKRYLTPSEAHIRNFTSYFTDINQRGQGMIYDQCEFLTNVKRFYIGKKCPLKLTQYFYCKEAIFKEIPDFLVHRIEKWKLFFHGDLLYRIWRSPNFSRFLSQMHRERTRRYRWRKWIRFWYRLRHNAIAHVRAAIIRYDR